MVLGLLGAMRLSLDCVSALGVLLTPAPGRACEGTPMLPQLAPTCYTSPPTTHLSYTLKTTREPATWLDRARWCLAGLLAGLADKHTSTAHPAEWVLPHQALSQAWHLLAAGVSPKGFPVFLWVACL